MLAVGFMELHGLPGSELCAAKTNSVFFLRLTLTGRRVHDALACDSLGCGLLESKKRVA